jgi:autotransporter passenger strand-loop-strand repeat protein
VIILDSFAVSAATAIAGEELKLTAGAKTAMLDLTGTLAGNLLVTKSGTGTVFTAEAAGTKTTLASGSFEVVTSGGVAGGSVINSGGVLEVYAKGGATNATVNAGGKLLVSSGGTETTGTIAGGTLDIAGGGLASGPIDFKSTGGTLVIEGASIPTNMVSGFVAGDTIKLSAVPYNASDTVKVVSAGIVTVTAGGKNYQVHIAGATVGETDFHFGSGSLLTKSTQAAKTMAFARPPAQALGDLHRPAYTAAMHAQTRTCPTPMNAPLLTMSAAPGAFAMLDLLPVERGGVQMTIALGHLW